MAADRPGSPTDDLQHHWLQGRGWEVHCTCDHQIKIVDMHLGWLIDARSRQNRPWKLPNDASPAKTVLRNCDLVIVDSPGRC